jgi:hypothetical protein
MKLFQKPDRTASTALAGDIATAEQRLAALEEQRRPLALAAHESNTTADRKALADHDTATVQERQRIRDLRDSHSAALERERSNEHQTAVSKREAVRKEGTAANKSRAKAADDIAAGAAMLARGIASFVAANNDTARAIVALGAVPSGGYLFDGGELKRAIEIELWRATCGPDPLKSGLTLGDPHSITYRTPAGIKSFEDVVAAAVAGADATLAGKKAA